MDDIEEEYTRSLEKQKSAIGSLHEEIDMLIETVEFCRQEIQNNGI
jgi:hypothetical protein